MEQGPCRYLIRPLAAPLAPAGPDFGPSSVAGASGRRWDVTAGPRHSCRRVARSAHFFVRGDGDFPWVTALTQRAAAPVRSIEVKDLFHAGPPVARLAVGAWHLHRLGDAPPFTHAWGVRQLLHGRGECRVGARVLEVPEGRPAVLEVG